VAEAIISPKARKEAKRAISLLKSQQFAKAEKQLDEAYKLAPTSAELNFLLGTCITRRRSYGRLRPT